MSKRTEAFNKLFDCPVHRSAMNKMSNEELDMCLEFIAQNDHLDVNQFAAKLNMWNVDNNSRPKNASTMWAMVCSANSAVHFQKRDLLKRS